MWDKQKKITHVIFILKTKHFHRQQLFQECEYPSNLFQAPFAMRLCEGMYPYTFHLNRRSPRLRYCTIVQSR